MNEENWDLHFSENQRVRVTAGDRKGETGFVKGQNRRKGLVQVALACGETLWFHSHKLEKFNPEI